MVAADVAALVEINSQAQCVKLPHLPQLKRDEIRMKHHRALDSCLGMIFSENRFTLFRIMPACSARAFEPRARDV
jgi:hypothetical protein